jgi:uncharacterized RDD family membrane protein YckC
MQCGAINGAEARTCCLCDTRLSKYADSISVSPRPQLRNEGSVSVEADWRSEVSQRLDAYRERHGGLRDARVQPELAFTPPVSPEQAPEPMLVAAQPCAEAHRFEPHAGTITKRRFRPARVERLEIDVEQPAFDFSGTSADAGPRASLSHYDSPVLSVAPLTERRRAGVLDVTLLLFAYGGFLTVFRALGGRFSISRFDLLITVAILGLLYSQYVTLFIYFAGATPGMMLRGLRVASLDGLDPSPRQLLWRSLGYLISAGTLMLGFLWVLWDEDQLSWHDRISQTCITQDLVLGRQSCNQPSEAR